MVEREHHEIARIAAEVAGRVASTPSMSPGLASLNAPAAAAKAVVDAYEAALKQLKASASSQS